MQVPYGEGVACHTGPAPCVREGDGEALERGSVGWVLSRESALSDADRVGKTGRRNGVGRYGKSAPWSGVVRDPMHAPMLLARKPGGLFVAPVLLDRGRVGKAKAGRRR